ncbi:MAG: 1-deoxy-D-xylulose-5-phosphate reductoisomerase [Spirochaetales bacterium]|nr:1-deoxy-D-xylulose-5-phosphate reductoisomerase [Spirochaetales bacterium]
MKKIIVLGATGSIGKSTLDIIRSYPERFQVAALSCHSRKDDLLRFAGEFGVRCLSCSAAPEAGPSGFDGEAGLVRMIRETEADCVVNGISGAAGFLPSVAAIESGKTLALANKETLVMAGSLVRELAQRHGAAIIPVDSEHSAVFQMIQAFGKNIVESLILTASGGPFRDMPKEKLSGVSVRDALKHPTWNMGPKITIDSATLANKGLEVIEAHHLFQLAPENIHVLIHPQSYVHSLIETRDGMQYAQIGKPDMRVPILNALSWPENCVWTPGKFTLAGMSLSFTAPDTERFPMLDMAYTCLKQQGSWPLVYNAANEIAVQAFISGTLPFTGIPDVVSRTLEAKNWPAYNSVEEVLQLDARSRAQAKGFCS